MNFQVLSLLNCELEPRTLKVEICTRKQIPSFHIVGLASTEISESRERIRAAVESLGLRFPRRKITINLSPAGIRKQGTGLELAIASAVLLSSSEHRYPKDRRLAAWGELGLDGSIKSVGQLCRLLAAASAGSWDDLLLSQQDFLRLSPHLELLEKALGRKLCCRLVPVSSLKEVLHFLQEPQRQLPSRPPRLDRRMELKKPHSLLPLSPSLQRIVEISAVGQHHLLLLGPKGSGKSHALEWRSYLEPDLDPSVIWIRQLAAELHNPSMSPDQEIIERRISPYVHVRTLIGSQLSRQGRAIGDLVPGEYTLAHGGLLLADELPEWPRDARESLRHPLEEKTVRILSKAARRQLPADFTLVATGNLCPCGETHTQCRCPAPHRLRYLQRLSGPVLDRIDLCLLVDSESSSPFKKRTASPIASDLRQKIRDLRLESIRRWGCSPGRLTPRHLEDIFANLKGDKSMESGSSLRSRHKVMRLALTLSLFAHKKQPDEEDWIQAKLFRPEIALQELKASPT